MRPFLITNGALVLSCCCCGCPDACESVDEWMWPHLADVSPPTPPWLHAQGALDDRLGAGFDARRECAGPTHLTTVDGVERAWVSWDLAGDRGAGDLLVTYGRDGGGEWTVLGAEGVVAGQDVVLGAPEPMPPRTSPPLELF